MTDLNGIRKTVLDNGLTVLLREMRHAPVASFWIWYRVGSRNERSGITGISHWVEHMLFKGTPTFPQGEFDKAIAREGGMFNGMTWIDFTTYFETLPSDRIDLALRVESDRMVNAVFDPQETELERTVIISERQGNENSPNFLLGEALGASAFQAHPYHHSVIGWQCDLETMTREQLYEHYRTYYTPNNAIVAVAGDFDPDAMLARIGELFGPVPAGPALPKFNAVEPPQRGERRVTVEGPGMTQYLEIAYRAPEATHPDYHALVILDTILGGAKGMSLWGGGTSNRSSRLYKAMVETELASDADCAISSTINPYLFSFSATVRQGRTLPEVESAMLAQIQKVMDEPISDEELQKAIKQTKAQFAYSSESVTDQGYWLGFSEIVADIGWFENFLERIEAVTVDDVRRVARTYFKPTLRNVGWYLPTGAGPAEGDDEDEEAGELAPVAEAEQGVGE
ncbi:MAG: insulinase family protein [Anaerolineae bacterium]|nr:insulinase family protein [Anaerolineae bacterium]